VVDTRLCKTNVASSPAVLLGQKRSSEGLNGPAMMLKILLYSVKETLFGQGAVVDVCREQSREVRILVCGQSTVILTLFEGRLLCAGNYFF
jgi:hypothetical protein